LGNKIWVVKGKKDLTPSTQQQSAPAPAPSTAVPPSSSIVLSAAVATDDMANFPVNPLAFLPEGMTVDHGPPDRKVRTNLVVPAVAPLHNDRVLIAETNRFIPIQHRDQMREDLRDLLVEDGHIVRYFDDHPFGLGVYTFPDTITADVVAGLTYELDEVTTINFVKHNEEKNMRLTTFGRETWLLYLGFPLDYQTAQYIHSAVEDFGLLSIWDNPRGNKKFVLVKAWIVDPKFVPKSLVMHQLGGARRCWTVPVIMLRHSNWNAHEAYVPPPPAEPEPGNGDPHPLYGPDVTVEQIYQHQLALWWQQNQNFAPGGHQQHGHQHVQHLQVQPLQQFFPDQASPVPDVQEQLPHMFYFQTMLAEQGAHYTDVLPLHLPQILLTVLCRHGMTVFLHLALQIPHL
jgi:hypothetical protein